LAALAALLLIGSACGGDDDGGGGGDEGGGDRGKDAASGGGDDDKDAAPPAGGGSADSGAPGGSGSDEGGEGGGEGGTGGDVELPDAGMSDAGGVEICGAEVCADPMCCADAFVSKCGVRINARACLPPTMTTAMSDERCPSVSIMGGAFMIASCCTDDGKCGINAAAAGMGCISLEEVRAFSSMGGMGMGFAIEWPEPQACN
jgi:hypothetical protein